MRLGFFASHLIHFHASKFLFVRRELQSADPFIFLRHAARHSEVSLVHLTALKQITIRLHRALTFGEQ